MGWPLQPDLRPWPPWTLRALTALALTCCVLLLGLAGAARQRPPRLLLSGPTRGYDYARRLERLVSGAERSIWVMQYVVKPEAEAEAPVDVLLAALAAAAQRGVRVQVCLDYGRGFASQEIEEKHQAAAAWLSAHGVRVVLDEVERRSHAKVVIIDRRRVVVGSHNWTRSALAANREASIEVEDAELAAELARELFAALPGWDADY